MKLNIFGPATALFAVLASATIHNKRAHQPDAYFEKEADDLANQVTEELNPVSMAQSASKQPIDMAVQADANKAKEAASVAKQAAHVANKVAEHSIHITHHAKKALSHALGALHEARVETQGLTKTQKESLKKAEGKLREATKTADYGKLKKLEDRNAMDLKKDRMQEQMNSRKSKKDAELEQMRQEIKHLREQLKEKGGDAETDKEMQDMEEMLNKDPDKAENDELKAEIGRLREQISRMEKDEGAVSYDVPKVKNAPQAVKSEEQDEEEKEELMKDVEMKPLGGAKMEAHMAPMPAAEEVTPVQEKGIDIDTQMPYGDLEPFGREDTAQELTESSVRESDEMVDQLERAEVAEEKRAVFRALTRLRGAAITSFDGVARSQTGNIDEYNKVHKWRKTHPLHHLADEESDVTKWAFPDNAD